MAWAETGGDGCVIGVHHWRSRKTGPLYPLAVAKCRTHRVAFTLYPAGYVPYGRVAMTPVDAEGQPVDEVGDAEDAEGKGGGSSPAQLAWDTTLFRAARDATQRLAWPRHGCGNGFGSWRTQGRWMAISAACLGLIHGDSDDWAWVGLLGVPTLLWREARARYMDAKGYVARGQAIMLPLEALYATGHRLLDMLLAAGFEAGCWGEPRRWDPRARRLRTVAHWTRPP